jgi:protein-disulfide isomerase
VKVPVGTSPVRGAADAWVTMVEFGDFECPYCGAEEPVVRDLLVTYGTDLRLVFKNFPLTNIHLFAEGAAIAAECANDQGQFWQMHDLLFANQAALDNTSLQGYAQTLGLNMPAWQACLTSQPPVDAINADVSLGTSIGVSGTPTFIINGVAVVGAVPESQLKSTVDSTLSKAKSSGIPAASYYDKAILGH